MKQATTSRTELILEGSGRLFSVGFHPDEGRPDVLVRISIRRDGPDGVLVWESLFRESDGFIPASPDERVEPGWRSIFAPDPLVFGRLWITQVGGRGQLSADYLEGD